MTKALELAFEKVRKLPADRQKLATEVLEEIASSMDVYVLSDEENRMIDEGLAELDRGEFVTQEEMQVIFDSYRT